MASRVSGRSTTRMLRAPDAGDDEAGTIGKRDLTDEDMLALASDVAFLWTKGLLRDEQRLRRIRNRALRQVPERAATRALDELVASLPKL